jgi:hypothetical protein
MAVCSLYENSEGKKSGPNFEASDGAESQISRENRVLRDDTEASGAPELTSLPQCSAPLPRENACVAAAIRGRAESLEQSGGAS